MPLPRDGDRLIHANMPSTPTKQRRGSNCQLLLNDMGHGVPILPRLYIRSPRPSPQQQHSSASTKSQRRSGSLVLVCRARERSRSDLVRQQLPTPWPWRQQPCSGLGTRRSVNQQMLQLGETATATHTQLPAMVS